MFGHYYSFLPDDLPIGLHHYKVGSRCRLSHFCIFRLLGATSSVRPQTFVLGECARQLEQTPLDCGD